MTKSGASKPKKRKREKARDEGLPATAPRSTSRHPTITVPKVSALGDEPAIMPKHEQMLSRSYFSLAAEVVELRQDLGALRVEVEKLKKDHLAPLEKRTDEDLGVTLLGASSKISDVVDLWMLRMDPRGIMRSTDEVFPPIFLTKLPFHYALPVLATEEEVAAPLRRELFRRLNMKESDERNAVFERLFQQRKTKPKTKMNDSTAEGFFQRYMRMRRQVKNDKIGKPVLSYCKEHGLMSPDSQSIREAEKASDTDSPSRPSGDWRLSCTEPLDSCFFFKVAGSRKLFTDVFSTSLDQINDGRTVLSIIQLAMLDHSVANKTKVQGKKSMASTASGSLEGIASIASSIANSIWVTVTNEPATGEEVPELEQPCNCCWVVDVSSSPGSPVADMLQKFNEDNPGEKASGEGKDDKKASAGRPEVEEVQSRGRKPAEEVSSDEARGDKQSKGHDSSDSSQDEEEREESESSGGGRGREDEEEGKSDSDSDEDGSDEERRDRPRSPDRKTPKSTKMQAPTRSTRGSPRKGRKRSGSKS